MTHILPYKHCTSGYVLSPSFVYPLVSTYLVDLLYLYAIHASHESAGWFGIYAHMQRTAQRHLDRASTRTFALHPERTPLAFSLAGFQGQLNSYLLSRSYSRAGGDNGFVYKVLLFLPSRQHACAMQRKTTLNLLESCKEAPCSKSLLPLR